MAIDEIAFTPLIADILTAQASETANVTNQVIDNLQAEVRELQAEIDLIRQLVGACFADGVMPTESRVLSALWPSRAAVLAAADAARGA